MNLSFLISENIKNKYNEIKNKIAVIEVKAIYIPFIFTILILKSKSVIINMILKSPVMTAIFLKKTMYFSIIIYLHPKSLIGISPLKTWRTLAQSGLQIIF